MSQLRQLDEGQERQLDTLICDGRMDGASNFLGALQRSGYDVEPVLERHNLQDLAGQYRKFE